MKLHYADEEIDWLFNTGTCSRLRADIAEEAIMVLDAMHLAPSLEQLARLVGRPIIFPAGRHERFLTCRINVRENWWLEFGCGDSGFVQIALKED